jgi:hypothetical protein
LRGNWERLDMNWVLDDIKELLFLGIMMVLLI